MPGVDFTPPGTTLTKADRLGNRRGPICKDIHCPHQFPGEKKIWPPANHRRARDEQVKIFALTAIRNRDDIQTSVIETQMDSFGS
jgi:hypothetical protein